MITFDVLQPIYFSVILNKNVGEILLQIHHILVPVKVAEQGRDEITRLQYYGNMTENKHKKTTLHLRINDFKGNY